jgi:hypothetical protein
VKLQLVVESDTKVELSKLKLNEEDSLGWGERVKCEEEKIEIEMDASNNENDTWRVECTA